MNQFMTHILNPFFYWLAWIIIPLLVEVLPSIGSFFVLLHQKHKKSKMERPAIWPDIVLIIPVYNSEDSLEECLEFIADDELVEITPKSIRMRKLILEAGLRAKAIHAASRQNQA